MDDLMKKRYDTIIGALGSIPSYNKSLLEQLHSSIKLQSALGNISFLDGILKDAARSHALFDSLAGINPALSSHAFDAVRIANLEFGKLSGLSNITAMLEQIRDISPPWQAKLGSLGLGLQSITEAQLGLQAYLGKVSSISILAEKSFAGIDLSNLGIKLGLDDQLRAVLQSNVGSLSQSYADLFKSLDLPHANMLAFHPTITSFPPIEYYNDATVTEALTSDSLDFSEEREAAELDISAENLDALPQLLQTVQPDLVQMLDGARTALSSRNPDRVRHFAISLRELHTHVIKQLAPDAEVKAWTQEASHYDEKGRPTRTARLLYIARHVNHGPFSDFVDTDIRSTLSLLKLFQKGSHEISSDFTEAQLHAIHIRAECSLRFLLEVGLRASGA